MNGEDVLVARHVVEVAVLAQRLEVRDQDPDRAAGAQRRRQRGDRRRGIGQVLERVMEHDQVEGRVPRVGFRATRAREAAIAAAPPAQLDPERLPTTVSERAQPAADPAAEVERARSGRLRSRREQRDDRAEAIEIRSVLGTQLLDTAQRLGLVLGDPVVPTVGARVVRVSAPPRSAAGTSRRSRSSRSRGGRR